MGATETLEGHDRVTSGAGLFGRWQRFVGERNVDFEVVGVGQRLNGAPFDDRPGEERHVGDDVTVDNSGVDLLSRYGLRYMDRSFH